MKSISVTPELIEAIERAVAALERETISTKGLPDSQAKSLVGEIVREQIEINCQSIDLINGWMFRIKKAREG